MSHASLFIQLAWWVDINVSTTNVFLLKAVVLCLRYKWLETLLYLVLGICPAVIVLEMVSCRFSLHTLQLLRYCVCQNDKGTTNLSQQIEKHWPLLWFSIWCRSKILFCTSVETNHLPLVIMQQKLHLYRENMDSDWNCWLSQDTLHAPCHVSSHQWLTLTTVQTINNCLFTTSIEQKQ